ncbi:MAG: DUF1009 domain-containing protein [Paracoccus denitrificans]|nr:MAG: DUF1009 domain-containing protein [Paracoccus denitrificans]PZO84452.1 MAG: DUF1009 domain-containing protein [Paracoccus denitrificans]
MTKTAVIAGQGPLAGIIATSLDDVSIYALQGFAPEGLTSTPFRLERLVPLVEELTAAGVSRVVFAGAVQRPPLDPEAFDPRTASLVPRMVMAIQSGDDAALRELAAIFEESDLPVVGAQEIVPQLVPDEGVLCGEIAPRARKDADRAAEILALTGTLDIGQGCVVAGGLCLAIETLPGTKAMLDFVAATRRGTGGVFYKAPKAGQDLRFDMPVIGPETVAQAAAANLSGIAWQAGGVMMLDRDATVAAAEAAGIFLWANA